MGFYGLDVLRIKCFVLRSWCHLAIDTLSFLQHDLHFVSTNTLINISSDELRNKSTVLNIVRLPRRISIFTINTFHDNHKFLTEKCTKSTSTDCENTLTDRKVIIEQSLGESRLITKDFHPLVSAPATVSREREPPLIEFPRRDLPTTEIYIFWRFIGLPPFVLARPFDPILEDWHTSRRRKRVRRKHPPHINSPRGA